MGAVARPTRFTPFRMLVVSSGLSNLADGIFKVALPLVAITYTRSPALVAGLEFVRSLPWLLGSLHIGAVIDRIDRRRAMVGANTVRILLVAGPAVAIATGWGSLWLLYLAAVGTGVAEVFYDTAAQSILPAVVGRSELDRANGRLYAVELGAQEFAGPPVAGLLVAAAVAVSFATSATLWVVAVIALVAVRGQFRPAPARVQASIWSDVREGFAFLRSRPILRRFALMVGLSNLATSATFPVLVLFAVGPGSTLELTEPQFGLLFATLAAGGLIGGLLAERVQNWIGRARTLTVSVVAMIGYVAAPALTSNIAIIVAVFFASGLALMLWNVTVVSFRQRVTPDHLLGRVNSSFRLVAWGTKPLGAILSGALGEWLGIRAVFILMGVLAAAVLIPNRSITEAALTQAESG